MKTYILLVLLTSGAVSSDAASVKSMVVRLTHYHASENTTVTRRIKVAKKKVVIRKTKSGKIVKKVIKTTKTVCKRIDTDPWTKRGQSATGLPLSEASPNTVGIAAVDKRLISFGSPMEVATHFGPRYYLAGDVGTAVKSRKAARKSGKTDAERQALVIDLYGLTTGTNDFGMVRVIDYKTLAPQERVGLIDSSGHGNLLAIRRLFHQGGSRVHQPWFHFGHRIAAS